MTSKEVAVCVAVLIVGIAALYGLALAGEPQSYWLLCEVANLCSFER